MPLFRRDTDAASKPPQRSVAPPEPQPARTYVAAGSRFEGTLMGATDVTIDGEVTGTVRVDAEVVVGASGLVEGPIAARVVRVAGRVVGDLRASDRVDVAASGRLEGDIAAPRVLIAEGAIIKGRIDMKGSQEEPVVAVEKGEGQRRGAADSPLPTDEARRP
jgi:cytoskeletal protein CcmA (bactofilin family)